MAAKKPNPFANMGKGKGKGKEEEVEVKAAKKGKKGFALFKKGGKK
jgi:hypothetical protein